MIGNVIRNNDYSLLFFLILIALTSSLAPTSARIQRFNRGGFIYGTDSRIHSELKLITSQRYFIRGHTCESVSLKMVQNLSNGEECKMQPSESKKINAVYSGQRGPLAMPISELAKAIGGTGRARVAWDLYTIGVDPQKYFQPHNHEKFRSPLDSFFHGLENIPAIQQQSNSSRMDSNTNEHFDSIQDLRATCRKDQVLGKDALDQLAKFYPLGVEGGIASLSQITTSIDGTTKLLLRLQDEMEVETVIIPWFDRNKSTLCLSSQIGCKQGCTFCATGRMGKLRSLTVDEIIAQIFYATKIIRLSGYNTNETMAKHNLATRALPSIDNIVFMGMGEPADNHQAVSNAIQILTDRSLFQLSAKKITVSTVAPNPKSFAYFRDTPCVLAWSVHAVDDFLRKQLVPTTQYTMEQLSDGLIKVLVARPPALRATMLEVVLIQGLNDGEEQAHDLAEFATRIIDKVKLESGDDENIKLMVNLIPFNDIGHPTFKKPSAESVLRFQKELWNKGIFAHIRTTRGDEESAACGQLATKRSKSHKHFNLG